MKTALFLFLSLSVFTGFSQSRKAVHKILLEQNALLVKKNDSLVETILEDQDRKLKNLMGVIYANSRNLADHRQEFLSLRTAVETRQKKLKEFMFDPNILVPQKELNAVYETYDTTDYYQEIRAMKNISRPTGIEAIKDLSNEKLKVQNELLAQKNKEYIRVIEINTRIVQSNEVIESKIGEMNQKMEAADAVLTKNNQLLRQKYEVLQSKCSELEVKKEQAEITAGKAKKEPVVKPASQKKKKEKTVRLIPPAVVDEKIDYPSDWDGLENASDKEWSYVPEPKPEMKEEKMINQGPVIFEFTDESPSFPGGREALLKYLQENIIYPQIAREAEITGKVYVKFVVSDLGAISNVKIMRGIPGCRECDQETVRVVKAMPKWIPGKNNGKAVNSYYNLPVVFKL